MRKILASAAVAAAVAAGTVGGAVIAVPALTAAQTDAPTSTEAPREPRGERASPFGKRGHRHHHHAVLEEALTELVEEGTLTHAQAGAVRDRVREKAAEHRGLKGEIFETAAGVLGMTMEELSAELRGKTLAEIAAEVDVAVDTLVAALVGEVEANIDEALGAGRITQEQADRMKENVEERITTFVNEGRQRGDRGHPGHGGAGRRGSMTPSSEGTVES